MFLDQINLERAVSLRHISHRQSVDSENSEESIKQRRVLKPQARWRLRIRNLRIGNYRTLESLNLEFPSLYTAICGENDSGKTNVIKAIRTLVRDSIRHFRLSSDMDLSVEDDYPKWNTDEVASREIMIEASIELDSERDAGFYEFVVTQLAIDEPDEPMRLRIKATYRHDRTEPEVLVTVGTDDYETLKAQEVLRKLQSSTCILFHNSTEAENSYTYRGSRTAGYIREITGQHQAMVAQLKEQVNKGLESISKTQQTELQALLGRLGTEYNVGLSMPTFDFGYMPFSITLGDKQVEVPLNEWGSGTRNRTMVLLTLFQARQIRDQETSAGKITPIIIVEEPESFLHPAAQAEFGRVLRNLAEEFGVQIIVTTHSPHLLNVQDPCANILLTRRLEEGRLRETQRVDTGSDNWMAPFGQALGLDSKEFAPWKEMMFAKSDAILLVEGATDKAYFELLRDPAHGPNRLVADCEIVPYEGIGAISNTVLLRFIKDRFERFFVTYDLDSSDAVGRTMSSLGLEKGKHYLPIGVDAPGKKCIEGLLPATVQQTVYAENPDVVQALTSASTDERRSARNKLKALLLEEFSKQAAPGQDYFCRFYPLVRSINEAFA